MLKAVGFTDADLQEAAHRRRQHLDRDRPVQLPPARPRRAREGRHPRRRRHADGVQHRLDLRRHHDGHRGHARVARQPRGDRRLDRAGRRAATASTASSSWSAATRRFPAASMALARLNIPGLVLYGGSIAPGSLHGHDVTIQDVFEAVGAHAAGTMSDAELLRARGRRRARAPAPAAASSPPTRWRWRASSSASRRSAAAACRPPIRRRPRSRAQAGERVMEPGAAAASGRATSSRARRSRTRSRRSRRPAARPTPCCTCSRSRAKPASTLALDDFDRISARVPLLADLKPAGRFVATDLHAAGGSPLVAKRLLEAGRARTARRRRSPAGRSARKPRGAVETPGQEVVRPLDAAAQDDRRPRHPARQPRARRRGDEGRGHRAHDASRPGARVRQRGGGVRRRPAPDDQAGRRRRHPLRGAERRAGHARDARRHRRDRGRGPRRLGRARHRRPLLGRDARPHGRPRRAGSGARRSDRRRPRRRHDRRSTSRRATLDVEIDRRGRCASGWRRGRRPAPRYATGVLAKYARLVSSASTGR